VRDAVIVGAARTAVGRRNGYLSGVHPADLSARVLEGLVERFPVEPAVVNDVVWSCVSQVGEQAFNIARTAVLSAGCPESVPGTTVATTRPHTQARSCWVQQGFNPDEIVRDYLATTERLAQVHAGLERRGRYRSGIPPAAYVSHQAIEVVLGMVSGVPDGVAGYLAKHGATAARWSAILIESNDDEPQGKTMK
jgi:hypothetical protein